MSNCKVAFSATINHTLVGELMDDDSVNLSMLYIWHMQLYSRKLANQI